MASGREPRVAVVGATGTVGSQIADLIGEREFPCSELILFAAEPGSSDSVESAGQSLSVARLNSPADLASFDIAFLAVPEIRALEIIEERPGPVLIDLSAAERMPSSAPMIAPGLVPRDRVQDFKAHKLLAVPHPAAQVIATVINAIGITSGFAGATVLAGASAGGRERVSELFNQTAELLNARLDIGEEETQLAFNLYIPENGSALADAIAAQVKTLGGDGPTIAVQFIQAPAFHGEAVAISVMSPAGEAREWIPKMRAAPGILFIEGDDPAGFVDAVGQEAVIVRMRPSGGGAVMWCVFDSARVAATTALWIAESLWFPFS
jgi:aspartate-semialdehyde dehydrogenase